MAAGLSNRIKIAFFGLSEAFDYKQIGGVESFTRRLALQLVDQSYHIDYILYGATDKNQVKLLPNLYFKYFRTFKNALASISDSYNHVVSIYLLPKDKFIYAFFREKHKHSMIFHFIYFNWPDSNLKRRLYFQEARTFTYNGKLFCTSKRQYYYVNKWTNNAVYLLPPVPKNYFLTLKDKPINTKFKIAFLGRIDPAKGIEEVIDLFEILSKSNRFQCSIFGIYTPADNKFLSIYNFLRSQTEIEYVEVNKQEYSIKLDQIVRKLMIETDILFLPYKTLCSTIDTPITILEAMASLCAVITKPLGNIADIYGESKFLLPERNFKSHVVDLLRSVSLDDIVKERKRIYDQNKRFNFDAHTVGKRFRDAIFA